jgi:diphosphomevalonate decarboxylase
MSAPRTATAAAHPNIALAKYWGKRPYGHNLPAVPSLSVTLEGMRTLTRVSFDDDLAADELELGGKRASGVELERVSSLLDRVRARAGLERRATVRSYNDFPTASGLASSASAFAALAVAAAGAAGLELSAAELSDLARRTSVSSARSLYGGYVELRAGREGDEVLSATELAPPEHWDLRIVVAVTREGAKDVGSSDGMRHTSLTSPYFPAWVEHAPSMFGRVRHALLERDLEALGEAVEHSALAMHAAAIAARPGVVYWSGATLEALAELRRQRRAGLPGWGTIDAGPHLKVLTTSAHAEAVASAMRQVPGVLRTILTEPGRGASLVDDASMPAGPSATAEREEESST